jgi:hypothetical protein
LLIAFTPGSLSLGGIGFRVLTTDAAGNFLLLGIK